MQLVLISPERDHPQEHAVVTELFAQGLERFHVRKPHASRAELETYVHRIPAEYRSRVVLHQHHDLVAALGLGGRHWRDAGVGRSAPLEVSGDAGGAARSAPAAEVTSRSCHDLRTLRASLGQYDAVFFGPVFPSISKPGYGPARRESGEALGAILLTRTADERRTTVLALGGISAETAPRALALGFDGIAVLGAVWHAADPLAAYRGILAGASVVPPLGNAVPPKPAPDLNLV